MNKKVMVALSGGVDSSVAVKLLLNDGYYVEAATLELEYDETSDKVSDPVRLGKIAADELGIKHNVFYCKELFEKKVKSNFVTEYTNGRTPNPCVVCNKYIKFGYFLEKSLELGFDYIATGHYAKIICSNGIYSIIKSDAGKKDQTYMLYNLNQEQLSRILFPCGDHNKDEIYEIAKANNLTSAQSKESLDICFIPDNDHYRYLVNHGVIANKGDFVDVDNNVIGNHDGIIRYTIGQRKGLKMGFNEVKYVIDINAKDNKVVLGSNDDLFKDTLTIKDYNLIEPIYDNNIEVKIRYAAPPAKAEILSIDDDNITIKFLEKQRAITPGQSAVFYIENKLIGGGIII